MVAPSTTYATVFGTTRTRRTHETGRSLSLGSSLGVRGRHGLATRMSGDGFRKAASRLAPGYARPDDLDDPLRGLGAALARYRVMAYVVGTGLATLCFVGVPLQYAAGIPKVDAVVGPIHGIFYMVYLLAAVDLSRRARFTLLQMAAMIGAGFVPLLAFVVEHRVTARIRAVFPDVDTRPATDAGHALVGVDRTPARDR